jgi:ADP-ribose pyrophosphatase
MSELLHHGKFLALYNDNGWEYVSRVNANGAAVLVPITDEAEIVLVEQYRVPVGCAAIELPAGLVGDDDGGADELASTAAMRELEEETGYRAGSMELIMTGTPSPGVVTELQTFYYASQLEKVSEGGGVEGESITVHVVPLAKADQWLAEKMAAGFLVDPKVYAGLYWAGRRAT